MLSAIVTDAVKPAARMACWRARVDAWDRMLVAHGTVAASTLLSQTAGPNWAGFAATLGIPQSLVLALFTLGGCLMAPEAIVQHIQSAALTDAGKSWKI